MDKLLQQSQRPKTICLVSNEIYPIHQGGIGRLMYNFACHNQALNSNVKLHILVPSSFNGDIEIVMETFKGLATIHRCEPLSSRPEELARIVAAAPDAQWQFPDFYRQSLEYFYGIIEVERSLGAAFTIVEFPDFGGWAMASIAAKRSGLALRETILSARLHSSLGLISRYEKYQHYPSQGLGVILDAERQLLRHADLVVGHVPAIVARNASHYGFDQKWANDVIVEFPLITIDKIRESEVDADTKPDAAEPDFIFSSRLQPFKRPDLFVKAAVMLLESNPTYSGRFRIVSYGWDAEYIQSIKDVVPSAFADQILFMDGLAPAERWMLLRRSIVVIPSDYESLCLFAFEASQAGSPVILNRSCEAFGAFDRWVDGTNCLMFDGTALDLARCMIRAIGWTPEEPASIAADAPYWLSAEALPPSARSTDLPKTTIVCHDITDAGDVTRLLLSLRSVDGLHDVDVVFFLPAAVFGRESATAKMLRENGIAVRFLSGFGTSAEEFGAALLSIDCTVAVLLPPGYYLHPHYLRLVRQSFAHQPTLAIVGTHVRRLDPNTHEAAGVDLYCGDLPSVALRDDIVAPPVFAFRPAILDTIPFDDRAGSAWKSTWLREAANRDVDIVILPTLGVDAISHSTRPRNSVRLTSGLIDGVGIEHGLTARLLAMEPLGTPDHNPRFAVQQVSGEGLRAVRQMWPCDNVHREFPLVRYLPEHGGLLVHPLSETVVAAYLPGPHGAIRLIEADVFNVNHVNNGIEVAIGLCARSAIDMRLAQAFTEGRIVPPDVVSDWYLVEPGQEMTLTLRSGGNFEDTNAMVLMARVPRGAGEEYCHLIYKAVRCHFVPKNRKGLR